MGCLSQVDILDNALQIVHTDKFLLSPSHTAMALLWAHCSTRILDPRSCVRGALELEQYTQSENGFVKLFQLE